MYWWIILVILTIATVIGIIKDNDGCCSWGFITAVLCGSIAFIMAIICVIYSVQIPQEVSVFEQQKAYIESHVSKNDIEDAALTAKKVELNDWLYNAQYVNKRWNGWTFYPDSVQDLQEIK